MQRLDVLMTSQVVGSIEYNTLYAKKLDVDMVVEETRRQWREARGKVVMLAIKSGATPAAAPPTASAVTGSETGGGAAAYMTMQ